MEKDRTRPQEKLIHIFENINKKFPPRLARFAAITAATLLGSGCDAYNQNPFYTQPPQQPESALITASTQPNPTQFESPLEFIAASETATAPEATSTFLPQIEASQVVTPETESQSIVLFSGHPSEGANFGDNGIKTDCNWGATKCGRDERLLWGVFLKDSSIPDFKNIGFPGVNNSRMRFSVEGTGYAKIQIVDSKYGKVLFDKNMKLPASVSINNEGVVSDGQGSFTGYGTELVVRPILDPPPEQAEQAVITNVQYEILGPVDPEVAKNPDPEYQSAE